MPLFKSRALIEYMGRTSSNDGVFGLGTTLIAVPAGATNAILITAQPGQVSTTLKYYIGSTLYLIGVPYGQTLTVADINANFANHYLFGTSETVSIDGPARFYLAATVATTVVMAIRGLSNGPL